MLLVINSLGGRHIHILTSRKMLFIKARHASGLKYELHKYQNMGKKAKATKVLQIFQIFLQF